MPLQVIDHESRQLEQWRPGVMTQMIVSAISGGRQLTIFDQFCTPGLGAPTHVHAVEEVLSVISGKAEIWVGEERCEVGSAQSVIIPAGQFHGFRNLGDTTLHVRATLASPIFEASYQDRSEIARRWMPEA